MARGSATNTSCTRSSAAAASPTSRVAKARTARWCWSYTSPTAAGSADATRSTRFCSSCEESLRGAVGENTRPPIFISRLRGMLAKRPYILSVPGAAASVQRSVIFVRLVEFAMRIRGLEEPDPEAAFWSQLGARAAVDRVPEPTADQKVELVADPGAALDQV